MQSKTADADAITPLARIRDQQKITQTELGKQLGLSQAQVARIENRQRGLKPEHAKKAAEILHCHWLELMEEAPQLTPREEILLAHFRQLNEAEQDRWVALMADVDMARAAMLTAFLHKLPDPDRKLLAVWTEMIAAVHGGKTGV